jgi:hypothetical protein
LLHIISHAYLLQLLLPWCCCWRCSQAEDLAAQLGKQRKLCIAAERPPQQLANSVPKNCRCICPVGVQVAKQHAQRKRSITTRRKRVECGTPV